MRNKEAEVLTHLILSIFRTNGLLLNVGDRLVQDIGLTGARWQTLAAVVLTNVALNAPQIASIMGVTRQGAQKQLDTLVADGLIEATSNPGHKRSPLYVVTKKGRSVYEKADRIQTKWANRLAPEIPFKQLKIANRTLRSLSQKLDGTASGLKSRNKED